MMQFEVSDILEQLGNPIAYYPNYSLITGAATATLLFCQLKYFCHIRSHSKSPDEEGWMYFRQTELEEMLRLSQAELKTARKVLKQRGLTIERKKGSPPMIGIKVCWDTHNALWHEHMTAESSFLSERRKAKYVPPANEGESNTKTLAKSFSGNRQVGQTGSETAFSGNRQVSQTETEESFSGNRQVSQTGSETAFSGNRQTAEESEESEVTWRKPPDLYIQEDLRSIDRSIGVPEISNSNTPEPEPDASDRPPTRTAAKHAPVRDAKVTQADPTAAAKKSSKKKFAEKDIPDDVWQRFLDLYAELKLEWWHGAEGMFHERRRAILSVINDFGGLDEGVAGFERALQSMRLSIWFQERRMQFDNLLTKGKIPKHAEIYRNIEHLLQRPETVPKAYCLDPEKNRPKSVQSVSSDRVAMLRQVQAQMQHGRSAS